jgi:hypothetical protein
MEVVDDEHELPLLLTELRAGALEVHDVRVEWQMQAARERLEPRHLARVAVHRSHVEPGAGEEE